MIATEAGRVENSPEVSSVIRKVMLNQVLFSAGHSLTSGAFLIWFATDLGAKGFLVALILALPELTAVFGLGTRPLLQFAINRKALFFLGTSLRALILIGIPLADIPWFRDHLPNPLYWLVGAVALANAVGGVSHVAYLSWLSDLAPEHQWGQLFFRRRVGKLLVLMSVPVAAVFLRGWFDELKTDAGPLAALSGYVIVFTLGLLLELLSLLPMVSLPGFNGTGDALRSTTGEQLRDLVRRPGLLWFLTHDWHLAFANGLTQSVFYLFSRNVLQIDLLSYLLLINTMHLLQLPFGYVGGRLSDSNYDRSALLFSVLIASSGLIFWLFASAESWWILFLAYALWGTFAVANLTGRNLLLKLSPRSDNTLPLGLFRLMAGFLAGVSGLIGGFWLDELLAMHRTLSLFSFQLDGYHIILLVSLLGRWTSVLWLLPVRQPDPQASRA